MSMKTEGTRERGHCAPFIASDSLATGFQSKIPHNGQRVKKLYSSYSVNFIFNFSRKTTQLFALFVLLFSDRFIPTFRTPTLPYLDLRLSSSPSKWNIGRRVVSIWHGRWQYLSRHSSLHPSSPNLLSAYLAKSSLVFQPSSCRLLGSIPKPD